MQSLGAYISLEDTLLRLKDQAFESLPYGRNLVSGMTNPETVFNYLKSITTYKSDPKDRELLQTAYTLFEKNWHGTPGYGDCDCFTILALACLYWIVDGQLYIVLAGNTKRKPSHIWAGFSDFGRFYDFDLTQPFFDTHRNYKYTQLLKTNL